jgi:hypothetical protein
MKTAAVALALFNHPAHFGARFLAEPGWQRRSIPAKPWRIPAICADLAAN